MKPMQVVKCEAHAGSGASRPCWQHAFQYQQPSGALQSAAHSGQPCVHLHMRPAMGRAGSGLLSPSAASHRERERGPYGHHLLDACNRMCEQQEVQTERGNIHEHIEKVVKCILEGLDQKKKGINELSEHLESKILADNQKEKLTYVKLQEIKTYLDNLSDKLNNLFTDDVSSC
ncbi:hypothetical protein Dimus_018606 [Dionaea muscipula]